MTCRLLCALLVLALCCRPSVCATKSSGDQDKGSSSLPPGKPQGAIVPDSANSRGGTPEITGINAAQPDGTSGLGGAADAVDLDGQEPIKESNAPYSADPNEKVQETATISETGGTRPPNQPTNGKTKSENSTSQGSSAGTVVPETSGKATPGPITKEGAGGSANPAAASISVTASVSAQSQKENAPTTTTTTTTKAPTTTTTTTTTTEAPSTTTTRAPSRLHEIDGSLSSSAWVCAPLLLAASALAYTTVG
ncbi:putative mucin TcMUCII [Trypanosoma cruzi]|uniref:Mucin TcMUCII, putative n=2 Tax=Trypanosoma cruzi TaxID=5693 RepID=Q4DVS7_TRYCC|nr:mucin TcMUCII, putative [Trypanosoma cruzi]EAN96636.1 mucin TcMUCII, putative [Trypanosoma cruzi]PWV21213.1 putative mucin TcMUCII [Trypanosoma cruzi]RNC38343.1 mucin TcMUCII [Trypanosoma cruzi]|eukprot:XP_818487.1 mucin TcMUCII [Trypanosoma cruzi strain CL Brener]